MNARAGGVPIEIREVVPEDGPALLDAIAKIDGETEFLGVQGSRPSWADDPVGRIRSMLQQGTGVYVLAVRAGEIIGYLGAWAGWVARTRDVILIPHVGIREAYRGQGVGTRLFEAVEAWARAKSARRLELRVAEDNARGRALYTRRGFREEGRIVDGARRGGQWRTDLWMGRALRDDAPPRWEPIELPRPSPRPDVGTREIRPLRADEAPLLQAWERTVLTGSSFHLKRPGEVSEVAEIARDLAAGAADPSKFRRAALVGDAGRQQVVGYVTAWVFTGFRTEHDGHFTLNVVPAYAGCGIGRTLIEALEAWAPGRGIHRLTTFVLAHNVRGLRFAGARGFRREIVSPAYAIVDGRSVDRIQLGKILS